MGRPLNNRYFGDESTSIRVTYMVNGEKVEGYIVKQLGTNKYVVQSGDETQVISLATTKEEATELKEGIGAICAIVQGEVDFISTLWSKTARTTSGKRITWEIPGVGTLDDPMLGVEIINGITEPTPEPGPTPEPEPEPGEDENEYTLQEAIDKGGILDEPYKITNGDVVLGDKVTVDGLGEIKDLIDTILAGATEAPSLGDVVLDYKLGDTLENLKANPDLVEESNGYDITGQTDFVDPTPDEVEIILGAGNVDGLTINGKPAEDYGKVTEYTLQEAYDQRDSLEEPYSITTNDVAIDGTITVEQLGQIKDALNALKDGAVESVEGDINLDYKLGDTLENLKANPDLVEGSNGYDITGQTDFVDPTDEEIELIKGADNVGDLTINGQPASEYVKPTEYTLQEALDSTDELTKPYIITDLDVVLGEITIDELNNVFGEVAGIIADAAGVVDGEPDYSYIISDTLENIESNPDLVGEDYVITGQTDFEDLTQEQVDIVKGAANSSELTIDGVPADEFEFVEDGPVNEPHTDPRFVRVMPDPNRTITDDVWFWLEEGQNPTYPFDIEYFNHLGTSVQTVNSDNDFPVKFRNPSGGARKEYGFKYTAPETLIFRMYSGANKNDLNVTEIIDFGSVKGLIFVSKENNESYALNDRLSKKITKLPLSLPPTLRTLRNLLRYNTAVLATEIGFWDTSNIEDMSGMFCDSTNFNKDLSIWKTGNVRNMNRMFYACATFNGSLYDWDVSKVTDMGDMFNGCKKFTSNLSDWKTGKLTNIVRMFRNCSEFNSDLTGFDTSNVEDMSDVFYECFKFNGDVSTWNTAKVKTMRRMFFRNEKFAGDVSSWNTHNLEDASSLFARCHVFNSDISGWDVSKVTNFSYMLSSCYVFNHDIGDWDVSSGTNFSDMFQTAKAFNQDISRWDVSSSTTFSYMFQATEAFNQDISGWNTKSATSMWYMFHNSTAFNQDLSNWCVPLLSPTDNFGTVTQWPESRRPVPGTCPRGEDQVA